MAEVPWLMRFPVALGVGLLLVGCGDSSERAAPVADVTASPSSASSATAAPASTTTVTASATASAEAPAATPCEKRGLELGGTGTREDMCKFEGDILAGRYLPIEDDRGVIFEVSNPWDHEVTWLSATVYYYDAQDQQMTIEVEGTEHPMAKVEGITVALPGKRSTKIPLGFKREQLPEGVAKAEVEIRAFGWAGEDAAYFTTTKAARPFRAVDGGEGLTAITECDDLRRMLEGCPEQFPDALASLKKSFQGYNRAAPAIKDKLRPGMVKRCQEAATKMGPRCTSN